MNDLKEKVNMNVEFYLDKDYRVNGANVDDLTRNE
jgi:cytochrome c oxidase assembly protein Cox11